MIDNITSRRRFPCSNPVPWRARLEHLRAGGNLTNGNAKLTLLEDVLLIEEYAFGTPVYRYEVSISDVSAILRSKFWSVEGAPNVG